MDIDNGLVTTTLVGSGARDVAFSADQSLLYVAKSDGHIDVIDVATQETVASWAVGVSLGAISLTEDGSSLLVTERVPAARTSTLYRVNTISGAVESFSEAGASFRDVEVVDHDTVFVDGEPGGRMFSLSSGEFAALPIGSSAMVQDGHLTLVAHTAIPNGPVWIYDDRVDQFTAQGSSSGYNWGSQAISESAGLVALFYSTNVINIYGTDLAHQSTIKALGITDGLVFDESGEYLYVYNIDSKSNGANTLDDGVISRYNLSTGSLVEKFFVHGSTWHNDIGFGNQILLSRDGNYITVMDSDLNIGGLQIIDRTGSDQSFIGTTGGDVFEGDHGDDYYIVNHVGDIIVDAAFQGHDRVNSTIDYVLSDSLEDLTLGGAAVVGGGNMLPNTITGNGENNELSGGGGNDIIIGGLGADTMDGGTGSDRYIVDDAGDVVVETIYAGFDTVESSVSFVLGDHVDHLTLTGDAAINGTGNLLDNIIVGNDADNVLDGHAANDRLIGGGGNDVYFADKNDKVIETSADGGIDRVEARTTYTLGLYLENLSLIEGSYAVNGTGNDANNIIIGNSVANILDGDQGADQLAGGRGNDTYIVDNIRDVVTEALGSGVDLVKSSVSFTLTGYVEQLTLTGTSAINGTGNGLANTLIGNQAGNRLDGGAGADVLIGGNGNDVYFVDNSGDQIHESSGVDRVESAISFVLHEDLENLTLTGASAINGTGNIFANIIIGNGAANRIDGGAGADQMKGGAGNDTYIVDNAGDRVVEILASHGVDGVQSSISYRLGDFVENLTLTGASAANGTGNALANVLTGNNAANQLNGGAGADRLLGGGGNDLYFVESAADAVVEASATGGVDRVQSLASFTLGNNVENLTLTGAASINGAGNALANLLIGNAGSNILNGGAGADRMTGAGGNDTYIVDHAGDLVTETSATGGTDLVKSSISFTLGAHVENLTLAGSAVVNGTGNGLANVLIGNAAANVLNGGAGADRMTGAAGNDTYNVDNAGDVVVETSAAGGTDLVKSSVSYTLGSNVEHLTLTGTAAIGGTGNGLSNVLIGNDMANVLNGGAGDDRITGGRGGDTLTGGLGADEFCFDSLPSSDTISDFVVSDDTILLDRSAFTAIAGVGVLAEGAFRTGTAAQDADDRIIYDRASGKVFYDADGSGVAAKVLFAIVQGSKALTHLDFEAYSDSAGASPAARAQAVFADDPIPTRPDWAEIASAYNSWSGGLNLAPDLHVV